MMSESLAQDIKRWRVDDKLSFKDVHKKFLNEYVDKTKWGVGRLLYEKFTEPEGNQIDGVYLTVAAMNYLEEDGWNQ